MATGLMSQKEGFLPLCGLCGAEIPKGQVEWRYRPPNDEYPAGWERLCLDNGACRQRLRACIADTKEWGRRLHREQQERGFK